MSRAGLGRIRCFGNQPALALTSLLNELNAVNDVCDREDCVVEDRYHPIVQPCINALLPSIEQRLKCLVMRRVHPWQESNAGVTGDRCKQVTKRKRSTGSNWIYE